MKLRLASRLFLRLILLLALLAGALPSAAFAAEKKSGKIVFLPFKVNTQPPQEHLRAGFTNVLATRLADRTGLDAVHGADKTGGLEAMLQKGNALEAKKILKNMQGSWLLVGSLEQQKDGCELLIHVFSSGKGAPVSFRRTVETLDKALPVLDELAGEIAEKVFRRKPDEEEQPLSAAAKNDGMSGFQTAHPDKAWRDGLYAAGEQPAAAENGFFRLLNSQSSGELELSLKAMDAGDLDSDGREEVLLLDHDMLLLCRFNVDRFQQIAVLPLPAHLGYHALHLMDIDGDGRLEIYISASNGSSPSSFVLTWDGRNRKFNTIYDQVPFYFRPDIDSAGNPVLLGQADGSIYRMTVNRTGRLVRAEDVKVPQGFGLYDFIRVDLDRDGRREMVCLTEEDKLLVLDQEGRPLWKSEDTYGASRDALGTLSSRGEKAELGHAYSRERLHLHTRIVAQDVTGDGRPEIIIGRNRAVNIKYFKRLRWFEGSSAAVLSWDGSRMSTLWETPQVPGYTVDYQMLPNAERPGRFRLFAAESSDNGNLLYFWTKEKSIIKLTELAVPRGKP